jgi:peptidoglycan/xylan/chitin deacetylase (PgdA/CDA1 family)
MDDRPTVTRNQQIVQDATHPARPVRYRSDEPHHRRRRRALVLAGIAAIALIVGIWAGAGGGSASKRAAVQAPTSYFGRVQVLAGNGQSSFASLEQAAENAAIDRTLAYTPYVRVAGAQHREVALTFDDGPGPFTPKVVSILQRENVPATFFQVGTLQKYFHDATSEIVAKGYPIGDHTWAHAPMSKLSRRDQQSQLLKEISATGDYGAPFPRMFRPPYGLWNPTTLSILRSYKMLMVLWTTDTDDYRRPGSDVIVRRVLNGARPGAIILMHDAGGNRQDTVDALPQIISGLRARGYKMVTIPRLLLDNPAPADQQVPAGLAGAGG